MFISTLTHFGCGLGTGRIIIHPGLGVPTIALGGLHLGRGVGTIRGTIGLGAGDPLMVGDPPMVGVVGTLDGILDIILADGLMHGILGLRRQVLRDLTIGPEMLLARRLVMAADMEGVLQDPAQTLVHYQVQMPMLPARHLHVADIQLLLPRIRQEGGPRT